MKTTFKFKMIIIFSLCFIAKSFSQNTVTNTEVLNLIKKKRSYNKEKGFIYKIQLYNGREKKAKSIKSQFSKIYYWTKTTLEYDSPDWKIFVGKYQTRLEADRALNKYREKFKSAIIVYNK